MLPWPALLVAAGVLGSLAAASIAAGEPLWPGPWEAAAGAALVVLLVLLQLRLRRLSDNRWAADAATVAAGLGGPLLLLAAAGDRLLFATAGLFAAFLGLRRLSPALAYSVAGPAVLAISVWLAPGAVPDTAPATVAGRDLVPAAFAGGALALPWLLLVPPGLALLWRRSDRRADAAGALAVLAAALAAAAFRAPGVPPALALAPALPLLAHPAAACLAWLRDRPAPGGPPLAGIAAGLVGAGLVAAGLETAARGLPFVAAGAAVAFVAVGLLWPGRASTRGRLTAFGAMVVVAGAVAVAALRAASVA